jgi:signal peptidase I
MNDGKILPAISLPAAFTDGLFFSTVYVGNSMYPTFRAPDVLCVCRRGFTRIVVGDVIVFGEPGGEKRITHRVIGMAGGAIRTRGDNNAYPDPWTLVDADVLGKVVFYQRHRKLFKVRGGRSGAAVVAVRRVFFRNRARAGWLLAAMRRRIAVLLGR